LRRDHAEMPHSCCSKEGPDVVLKP
jgi:hypothetical protein